MTETRGTTSLLRSGLPLIFRHPAGLVTTLAVGLILTVAFLIALILTNPPLEVYRDMTDRLHGLPVAPADAALQALKREWLLRAWRPLGLAQILMAVLASFTMAGLIGHMAKVLRDGKAGLGDFFGSAAQKTLSLAGPALIGGGASFVLGLLLYALIVPVLAAFLDPLLRAWPKGGFVLMLLLGNLLPIALICLLQTKWILYIPAVALEGRGALEAVNIGIRASTGRLLTVFWVLAAPLFLFKTAVIFLRLAAGALGSRLLMHAAWLVFFLGALAPIVSIAALLVLYAELRAGRTGVCSPTDAWP